MKTLINYAAITAAALLCAPAVLAEDSETLDTVVVTASRVAETENDVLAPITVITREDIERYQPQSLSDLLRRVPGVSIARNGGRGQQTSVFLRGNSSKQTLVLINGVRVRDANFGNQAPFQHISVSEIERIEIVRGPRSSLYGSAGIGGVIQIFTRSGSGTAKSFAELSAGRYGAVSGSTGFSGSEGNTRYSLSIGAETAEGFDVFVPSEPDNDGYKSFHGSAKLGHKFGETFDTEVSILQNNSEVDYDGFFNSTDSRNRTVNTKARYTPNENLAIGVTAGRYTQNDKNFSNGIYQNDANTTIDSVALQTDLFAGELATVTAGAEYLDETLQQSADAFGGLDRESSRYNKAGYIQTALSAGSFDAQLNLRRDLFEGLNDKNTGSLAFGLKVTEGLQLLASYGEAFRYAGLSNSITNPELEPEYAKNYEVGARLRFGAISTAINAYHNDVENEIIFDPNIGNFGSNVNRPALIRGVELEFAANFASWIIGANVSRIDSFNRDTGRELVLRPKVTAQLDLDKYFGAHSIGFSVTSSSSARGFGADPAPRLDSYTVFDLRGVYQITPSLSLNAAVNNAGNDNYQTSVGYRQPGAALNVTLRYQQQ